jgi:hypothetical protein
MVPPLAPSFAPTAFLPRVGYAGMNPAPPQGAGTGYSEEAVD